MQGPNEKKMQNFKGEVIFLSCKIIWMNSACLWSGIWHVLHGYFCFKKLY